MPTFPATPFADTSSPGPAVRGFLHQPAGSPGDALVLTHGAGSSCEAPLLVAMASAFAAAGLTVLRCDLPFRQARPKGPPVQGCAAEDREGLRSAVRAARAVVPGRIFLGGHSYGGRQASMLAAAEPGLVDGLLLLSYPLHPPRRPDQLRTAHFQRLQTVALFVHGTRDPFGSPEEMRKALALIPAATGLILVEGGTHDLAQRRAAGDVAKDAVAAFGKLAGLVLIS